MKPPKTIRIERSCEPQRLCGEIRDAVLAAGGSWDIGVSFMAHHERTDVDPKVSDRLALAMYALVSVPEPLWPFMDVIQKSCDSHVEDRKPLRADSAKNMKADLERLEKLTEAVTP
jgi:hypothetical protein